ncbi:MAG TPA: Obg family GTPase CgtA, partial [Candidatus Saccharimonadia bacterium]
VHLIDVYSEDIVADYQTIQNELKQYKVDLSNKPQLVVLSKTEGMPKEELQKKKRMLEKAAKVDVSEISAVAGRGIKPLLAKIVPLAEQARTVKDAEEAEQAIPVIDEASQPNLWQVEHKEGVYYIGGEKLEGFARRTDWENDASVERLRDILRKNGIDRELRRLGAEPGAALDIGGHSFEWLG